MYFQLGCLGLYNFAKKVTDNFQRRNAIFNQVDWPKYQSFLIAWINWKSWLVISLLTLEFHKNEIISALREKKFKSNLLNFLLFNMCALFSPSFYSQKLRATIKDHQDVSKVDKVLSDSLKNGRPVFIKGFLREKCIERGLTLPDSGGDIKMRSFLDSLKHACKVPNTEQPFACLDLMFLGTLLDQFLGFKQGSMLHSSTRMGGKMDGSWPLALAFHIYQNGLWLCFFAFLSKTKPTLLKIKK